MEAWKKDIYIAKRIINTNENGNDYYTYSKPIKYRINYQPLNNKLDYKNFGENKIDTYIAYVDRIAFQGKINTGDRVYLSDEYISEKELEKLVKTDTNECLKANYKVISVLPQNIKTQVKFEKI